MSWIGSPYPLGYYSSPRPDYYSRLERRLPRVGLRRIISELLHDMRQQEQTELKARPRHWLKRLLGLGVHVPACTDSYEQRRLPDGSCVDAATWNYGNYKIQVVIPVEADYLFYGISSSQAAIDAGLHEQVVHQAQHQNGEVILHDPLGIVWIKPPESID